MKTDKWGVGLLGSGASWNWVGWAVGQVVIGWIGLLGKLALGGLGSWAVWHNAVA